MAVRAATDDDMPAVRRIARRFDLLTGWPAETDFLDAERAFGALLVSGEDDGEGGGAGGGAAGFGGTLRRGALTHLGDLFVLPERQSSGTGRALLERLLAGDGPKVTFASSDPRAMALYVRRGLRPWTPLLYLSGPTAGLPAGSRVRAAGAREVAAADARAAGGARPGTLAWYAALPGVTVHVTVTAGTGGEAGWEAGGEAGGEAGYAFARRLGREVLIGPAGGDSPDGCARAVLGALAAVRGAVRAVDGAPQARLAVPGTHPLVPVLLGAGWRIGDMDTFMADDAALDLVRPDRYVPHPDLG
ncbi:hypothetical protein [Nonomuraea sp. NPDC050783]|uniref:hypothetical protein n=1 Tax=Nonomuraea sp. NPDC050783 TaxID=3154634 RepID=UPI00346530B4